MPQKIYCPKCGELLIKNWDLVIDTPIILDIGKIKEKNEKPSEIKCEKCKRRIRYLVDKD